LKKEDHHPLYSDLTKILEPRFIADERFAMYANLRDGGIEKGRLPGIIARPQNTEQVSKILRLANQTQTKVTIRGAASQAGGGATPLYPNGIVVDTTDMSKIIEIDEDAMTITALGGTTFGHLIDELGKRGFTCCLGPHAIYTATVGGCVASNSICIGSGRYGQYGEQVVSLEVVLPTGEIVRTGSDATTQGGKFHRYCNGGDMSGIFIGSAGIFGVITEVTVWIEPEFETKDFATYCFDSVEKGTKALIEQAKIGLYDAYQNYGKHTMDTLRVRGGSYKQVPEDALFMNRLCVVGEKRKVEGDMKKIDSIAKSHGGISIDPELAKSPTYDIMGDSFSKLRAYGVAAPIVFLIPIYKIPEFVRLCDAYMKENERYCNRVKEAPHLRSWSSAGILSRKGTVNFAGRMTIMEEPPDLFEKGWKAWRGLVDVVCRHGGCPYWTGKTWTSALVRNYRPDYYIFLRRIKQTLDPNNILNPGLLLEDIDNVLVRD